MSGRRTVSDHDSDASCPRCGYSQRGVIASWRDACPLAGRCAECGLDFVWSELLRPSLYEPRWCVEYAPRRRWLPPRVWPTILRSAWPWWFWRSLKMSHPIRPRRLLAYVLILVVAVLATAATGQAALAIRVRYCVARDLAALQARPRLPRRIGTPTPGPAFRPESAPAPSQKSLQGTESEGKTEAVMIQEQLEITNEVNAPSATVNHSYFAAVAEAILTPWSARSRGSITMAWGTKPYLAPRELYGHPLGTSIKTAHYTLLLVGPSLVGLSAGLGLFIFMPLSFVLLPVSRHKARVRWSHVARVVAYGLLIPAVLVLAAIVFAATVLVTGRSPIVESALIAMRYAPVAMVVLWWAAAIRDYLKIPHAWALAGMLTLMNLLLLLAGTWFMNPELAIAITEGILP